MHRIGPDTPPASEQQLQTGHKAIKGHSMPPLVCLPVCLELFFVVVVVFSHLSKVVIVAVVAVVFLNTLEVMQHMY